MGKSIFTSGVLAGSPTVTEPAACGAGIVGNAGRSGRLKLKSGAAEATSRARRADGNLYGFMEIGHLPGRNTRTTGIETPPKYFHPVKKKAEDSVTGDGASVFRGEKRSKVEGRRSKVEGRRSKGRKVERSKV